MNKIRDLVGRELTLIESAGLANTHGKLTDTLAQAYAAEPGHAPASQLPADIMDFGEIYREARIEPPAHGYGIDKVESMLNHPGLAAMRPEQRAFAVLAALEAAGIDFTDVLKDAVLRDQAIERFALAKQAELLAERVRPYEAMLRAKEKLDEFLADKRVELEGLRREVKEAEERFARLGERQRFEERRIIEVLDHVSDAPNQNREESPPGSPFPKALKIGS